MTNISHSGRQAIEKWMLSSVGRRGFEQYDDLHIDQIEARWADRAMWIDGGLEALQYAVSLRDQHALSFTVALAYSLVEHKPQSEAPRTRNELAAQMDWSPPSLYLFRKGREPWVERGGVEIEAFLGGSMVSSQGGLRVDRAQCYYMEFSQGGRRYRSIFVAS
jgi:hypothetical protein